MKNWTIAAAIAVLAAPAFADGHAASGNGDAAAGEEAFNRQCVSCHVVADADGNVLAGRASKTGPNLYGLAGRQIGSVEGFRYGDAIVAVGADGKVWTEAEFIPYVMDPRGYLQEQLDDGSARSKMSFRVRDEQDAVDIYAFLATFGE